MSGEILKFDNVTVGYGQRDVVRDFSCAIMPGEFVSLIGPNGSGKSTLVHTVTGIVELKKGTLYLDGKDNSTLSARERARITAVVPQTFTANFGFKAKEIVAMGRHPFLKRMQSESEEDYRIIDEALAQTGTLHLRERKITQLSGGERQRIIISAALAQQPKLLILDEPTNHLDIQYTLEIMELMKRLNVEQGITILAVLHDINMAARFSDRIIVLSGGRKVNDGPAAEIISEEVLKPVYKIDLVVRKNPLTCACEIVPLRSNKEGCRRLNGKSVHIICGGGSGSSIIEEFYNRGWQVSCGVLNSADSDCELCRSLGMEVVLERPYCDIGSEAYEKNLHAASQADLVVVSDVDVGQSNLKNIEILRDIQNKPVYILREKAKDYTDGKKAEKIFDQLRQDHQAVFTDREGLSAIISPAAEAASENRAKQ